MMELGPGDVANGDGGVVLEHGGDDDVDGNVFLEADDT